MEESLQMASSPIITMLEQFHVSPPPATIGDRSLPLTFFDIVWLPYPPVNHLYFYEFPLSKTKNPEIRYVEGDAVVVTIAESTLDFNDLVGNHPRDCDKFYPLVPLLGQATKVSDYVKIPVFSIQVTLFPNCGFSIGITNHHSLGDASTRFCFLKAWTSIARTGSDESFLVNGTLPFYDRVVKHPELDELYIKQAKVETFCDGYQPPCLSGPSDKVRVTLVLTRAMINQMKKWVLTHHPTLQYVSSFTVACGYVWSCFAKLRNDGLQVFGLAIDCRARLVPPIPATYFGNCAAPCMAMAKAHLLTEKEGFATAVRLLGESLYKMLNDEEGIMKDAKTWFNFSFEGKPTTITGVAGTPRLEFYDTDFGWGKPKKYETVSIDYSETISMNTTKESNQDLEIGVCLSRNEMEAFIGIFNGELENYM
ncbi:hypothetical protein Lser_V15G40409 [Lactuca serriola]